MKFVIITILLFASAAYSQDCPPMPQGKLCIDQATGNRAAELARENPLLKEKIAVLEAALIEKDKNYAELKAAKDANEADLKKVIHDTEVKLATSTGQVIQLEADRVRWSAVVDVLIKNSRKKSIGIIAF